MPGDRGNHMAAAGGVGGPFAELFRRAGRAYGLDPALLWAVAMTESSLNPRAVSPVGAMGLMQLMPGTARMLGCEDPFDPAQNIDAGARYLRQLLDQFGDVALALAAYNAGPHVVERYGGIPPYRETIAYVDQVQRLWQEARGRQGAGAAAGGARRRAWPPGPRPRSRRRRPGGLAPRHRRRPGRTCRPAGRHRRHRPPGRTHPPVARNRWYMPRETPRRPRGSTHRPAAASPRQGPPGRRGRPRGRNRQ